MNIVEPIRNKKDLKKIEKILVLKSKRDFLLFVMGINSGLRISDILSLNVSDVKNKSHICLIEKKTSKYKKIVIKCDIQGAEFEVIEDLYNNNLLEKIDIILLETHFRDSKIIDNFLKKSNFVVFDTIDYIPNNIHMVYAVNIGKKTG